MAQYLVPVRYERIVFYTSTVLVEADCPLDATITAYVPSLWLHNDNEVEEPRTAMGEVYVTGKPTEVTD